MMLLSRPLFARTALRKLWCVRVVVACGTAFMLFAAPWAVAQTVFNYTGAVQTYTVPPGVRVIQIESLGAGGGGGGSDSPGAGGTGGRGARVSAIYRVVPGTVLNVMVGGGGSGAAGSAAACTDSGGAGGLAGGVGGYAGGPGGNRGCAGYSGAGGGGGGASVVTTQAGGVLLIAGGGGGGQGGALSLPGRDGLGDYTLGGTSSYLGPVTNSSGPLPADATYCAAENAGGCNFSGTMEVWYGAQSSWAVAPASNGVPCDNSIFVDPAPGVTKACYYRPYAGSWTPPPRAGAAGDSLGGGDGGGGGGGGGGCSIGPGGAANPDGPGPNNTTQASGGRSCVIANLPLDGPGGTVSATGSPGGSGGLGNALPGQPGAAGSVVITYPKLTLAKSQPSPAMQVGVNSVYTLTVTNTNTTGVKAYSARVVDQLPANITYIGNGGSDFGWSCSSVANAGGRLVTCNFSGTIAANGGTSVLQLTVRPTSNLTVTNYASVDPTGGTSTPTATTCTAANTPSAGCAAPVVSTVGLGVAGTVYNDANHNGNLDAGESGIGGATALWVKLVPRSGGTCNGPATVAASVNLTTGAYSFTNAQQGDYCLVVNGNATLSDITVAYPTGFIGTQNPTGMIQFSIGGTPPPPQNFGLYNGSALSGNVFADNGAGGGSANNGVKAGAEPGLAGITVNAMQGATTLDSGLTASDGTFTLWIPASASGTVVVTPALPAGYIATGGSAGTTGGTYTRPSVSYTAGPGLTRTGISFGMVAPNTLGPNGVQTAQPGTVVFYAHTYKAGTDGQVSFSMASPAWSQVLYQDSNCNAALEASEPQVPVPLTVTAGQTVCLIVKQFVPAGIGQGAQNNVTLSAAFSYTGSTPALAVSTLVAADITTVGRAGDLSLAKLVSNVTQAIPAAITVSANPGDTLQYTLTATNNGTQPLSTLFVSDSTTAFTGYVSAACPGTLPAGITACTVTTQPAVGTQGALKWTFTGSLASGAQLVVTYRVKVDQ